MANSLFTNNIFKQFEQFRSNPVQYLISKRINIPQEYLADPHKAVEYLMQNGQMSQEQLSEYENLANKLNLH